MWDFLRRGVQGVATGALSNDPVDVCILAAGTAVAWVYAIELNITIFLRFKRRRGVYFWSLLACSWGLSLHALGFILKFLVGSDWLIYLPFVEVGWVAMVTGQAVVLYSRLHLVVRNPKTLRYVLCLIIFDAFALHTPTIVLTYGSNDPYTPTTWQDDFNIMERIQLAGFCIQEFIISGVYLWSTVRIFRSIQHNSTRRVMTQLIIINALCIGMDIVLISLEYTNKYVGEASIKPMIYAIKLKLEFAVLNQLVNLTLAGRGQVSRRVVQGYELSNHDPAVSTGVVPLDPPKKGFWSSARAFRDGSRRPSVPMQPLAVPPGQIYKTSHIEVVNERTECERLPTKRAIDRTRAESPSESQKEIIGPIDDNVRPWEGDEHV